MKQEELFLSIEQCKHLQELGLDMSDGAFGWSFCPTLSCGKQGISRFTIIPSFKTNPEYEEGDFIYTYTLQEIIDKLPKEIIIGGSVMYNLYIDFLDLYIGYANCPYDFLQLDLCDFEPCKDSIMINAYKLLCWVIENGYLKV